MLVAEVSPEINQYDRDTQGDKCVGGNDFRTPSLDDLEHGVTVAEGGGVVEGRS
jgi:hypothetical protein